MVFKVILLCCVLYLLCTVVICIIFWTSASCHSVMLKWSQYFFSFFLSPATNLSDYRLYFGLLNQGWWPRRRLQQKHYQRHWRVLGGFNFVISSQSSAVKPLQVDQQQALEISRTYLANSLFEAAARKQENEYIICCGC